MERLIFGILRYINALRMSHCVGNHPFKRNPEITLEDIRHNGIPINQMSFGSVSLPCFNATYIYTRICKIARAKFQTLWKRKKKSKQKDKTSLFPNVTQIWQQQRILKEKRPRSPVQVRGSKTPLLFSRAHTHARARTFVFLYETLLEKWLLLFYKAFVAIITNKNLQQTQSAQ